MKTRSMKSSLIVAVAASLIAVACSKSNNSTPVTPVTGTSYLAVTNVSPTSNTYGVYANGTNIYPGRTIGYGSSTGVNGSPYETIGDSTQSIYLDNNGVRTNIDSAFAFQNNAYYSLTFLHCLMNYAIKNIYKITQFI